MSTSDTSQKPLLDFALARSPDPPQASPPKGATKSLRLRFVASVPPLLRVQGQVVYCDTVTFTMLLGPAGSAGAAVLTSDATKVVPALDPTAQWDLESKTAPLPDGKNTVATWTFRRPRNVDPKVIGQGYRFQFDIRDVSPVVGTAEVVVTEHAAAAADGAAAPGTTAYQDRSRTFRIPKFPPEFGAVAFNAVLQGDGSVLLSWNGDDSATYDLSWTGHTEKDVKASDTRTVNALAHDTVFTLTVTLPQGDGTPLMRQLQQTIQVSPVAVLYGDRDTILGGEPVTLTWDVANVHGCVVEGAGTPPPSIDRIDHLQVKPGRNATYRLSCKTAGGKTMQSTPFSVTVRPKAPASRAQLVFIRTSGNDDGKVSIHVDDGDGRFQQRLVNLPTGWAEGDGASGTLAIASYRNATQLGFPDLVLIKTRNTATGFVEVHACFSPQHGQGDDAIAKTPFSASWGPTGTWLIAPMYGAILPLPTPDVVLVKTAGTSGQVEVYYSKTLPGYATSVVGPWASAFPAAKGPQGTWLLGYLASKPVQPPDLAFVQTSGTASKHVELSYATGSSYYSQLGTAKPLVTGFGAPQPPPTGTWQLADMDGDGTLDLVFVKTAKTASGRVEIRWATAASNYQTVVGGFTEFDVADAPAGAWRVLGATTPARFTIAPAREQGGGARA